MRLPAPYRLTPAVCLALSVLLPLAGGACYQARVDLVKPPELTAAQIQALSKLTPAAQEQMIARMETRATINTADVFQRVERTWHYGRTADGGITIDVTAAHTGDVEMLNAAGNVAANVSSAAIGAAVGRAPGTASVIPIHGPGGPTAPDPAPAPQ